MLQRARLPQHLLFPSTASLLFLPPSATPAPPHRSRQHEEVGANCGWNSHIPLWVFHGFLTAGQAEEKFLLRSFIFQADINRLWRRCRGVPPFLHPCSATHPFKEHRHFPAALIVLSVPDRAVLSFWSPIKPRIKAACVCQSVCLRTHVAQI